MKRDGKIFDNVFQSELGSGAAYSTAARRACGAVRRGGRFCEKKHFKSAVLMILKNNFHETYMICGTCGGCGAACGGRGAVRRGAARREFFSDLPNTALYAVKNKTFL